MGHGVQSGDTRLHPAKPKKRKVRGAQVDCPHVQYSELAIVSTVEMFTRR